MIIPSTRTSILLILFLLTGCGTDKKLRSLSSSELKEPASNASVKVGEPYKVSDVWYYPRRDNYYDVTGTASWYGPDFHGKKTANGEKYDMNALTAAHTTLPLPSYVRVTNLSNSRSLVLRVNDRGPFVNDRIIDVSRRAAQLLGFEAKGTERVRVQVVQADGSLFPKPVDGSLTPVPMRTANDNIVSAPLEDPQVLEQTSIEEENYHKKQLTGPREQFYVQIGAYASEENARQQAPELTKVAPIVVQGIMVQGTHLYRLRLGAFDLYKDAEEALKAVRALGFNEARIFTESAK